jgi:hypothetical protein
MLSLKENDIDRSNFINKTILGFILACSFVNSVYASGVDYVYIPREVKSIAVSGDRLTINFDKLPSFQIVYKRDKNERVIPLDYGTSFAIDIGENIGRGDGDHYFASITLIWITNNKACITLIDEHRSLATHINLDKKDRKEYIIDKNYIRKD